MKKTHHFNRLVPTKKDNDINKKMPSINQINSKLKHNEYNTFGKEQPQSNNIYSNNSDNDNMNSYAKIHYLLKSCRHRHC